MSDVRINIYQPKSKYGWWWSVIYRDRHRLEWARTKELAEERSKVAASVITDDRRNVDPMTVAQVMAPLYRIARKIHGDEPCVRCKVGRPASMSGECLQCHRLLTEDR